MKGGENWYARLEFFMPQIIAYLQHIMSHLIIRLLQNIPKVRAPYSKMHEIEEGQVGIHRFVVREEVIVKKSVSFLATIAQMTSFQSLLWNS